MKPLSLYKRLLKEYGPQHWWPAETQYEIIVGAILTQNTAWKNVEKAVKNLKERDLLSPEAVSSARVATLESCIRPAGFFRQKAERLKHVTSHFLGYPSLDAFFGRPTSLVREELLSWNGIGPETADSILLYAGGHAVFVVDAYTRRLCERLGWPHGSYEEVQSFFERGLPRDAALFNEFHALIVEHAKRYCRKNPLCPCFIACARST
ncbi:MAG: endonuclease III domain-containing protein [Candidatus Diapherotrites archaeon]|nr:endonuclease III domain-containing protein [Candidatus Diapherotrites archaeon]